MAHDKMFKKPKNSDRNKPCPCGARRKYKHCCINKKYLDEQSIIEIQRKHFNKQRCLAPFQDNVSCEGRCSSHSISKSSILKKISKDGHVISIKCDVYNSEGIFLDSVGVQNASTFNGFCAKHDCELFNKIDKHNIEINDENAFLLSYRSFCRELYCKIASIDACKELIKRSGIYQKFLLKSRKYTDEIVKRDMVQEKNLYDEMYLKSNFTNLVTYVVQYNKVLPIVASTSFIPYFDMHGKKLQDPNETEQKVDSLTVNLINIGDSGYMIISTLDKNITCLDYIESLSSKFKSNHLSFILNFMFEYSENIYLDPGFWEMQTQNVQEELLNRFRAGVGLSFSNQGEIISYEINRTKNLFDELDLKGDEIKAVEEKKYR